MTISIATPGAGSAPAAVLHRQSIDLARFLASLGVVIAHHMLSPVDLIGHTSLSLFLILTAYLSGDSAERHGGRYPWVKRARRIVIPWLIWCAIYRLEEFVITDGPERYAVLTDPWSLLIGPVIHLWFLPFIMLAMALVQPVTRLVRDERGLMLGLGLFLLFWPPLNWIVEFVPAPMPLPQWGFALPFYIYGLLLAPAHRMGRVSWLIVAMAAISLVNWLLTGMVWAFGGILAALLFELFWRLPLRHPLLPALGRASFGIYLMHPAMSLIGYKLLGSDAHWLPLALIAFFLSWGGTLIWLRLPVLRNLV